MRRRILHQGARELTYEIREIVKVASRIQRAGVEITWENIGDPVQKGTVVPEWMRRIVGELAMDPSSYAYSPTKGVDETRRFLARRTNRLGGAQITEEDILFCNGIGDAISKVYEYLEPGARVIGPSPAYSTHSSAEGSHASQPPLTYRLDPHNRWYPDMEDLANKVKYNPNVVGILVINPDNPTGMVYPEDILRGIVRLAEEFDLFLVADEIYNNITYGGVSAISLCRVIGEVCGISMQGISKELPWPGSRCGWMEFYNTHRDEEFQGLVRAVENAKMLEVCSTTLPQLAIPKIFDHPDYSAYRRELNRLIEQRGDILFEGLSDLPELLVNRTFGAFYNTVVFRSGVLNSRQSLPIEREAVAVEVETLVSRAPLDKRFVYYLLGSTGICVVPISSFCSELFGFRVTLLESDLEKFRWTVNTLREAIRAYLASAPETPASRPTLQAAVRR